MPVAPTVAAGGNHSATNVKRRWHQAIDLPLLLFVGCLTAYGLVIGSSVTQGTSEYSPAHQAVGVALGVIMMAIMWRLDYRAFEHWVMPLLVIDVVLLLSPHLPGIGVSANGATSWVRIAGVQLQPGEPAKIVTILLMAAVVARYRGRINDPRDYLHVLFVLGIPFVCIMLQPDLGSGLVILIIGATILFVGGASWRHLLITIAILGALVAAALALDPVLDAAAGHDVFIKTYQMNRLLVFLNPDLDPTGVGYNLRQAQIAIGSGGVFGKGLGNATQSALGFLPEAPTDFIFCVVGESTGFMGSLLLLALYAGLFACTINVMRRSRDRFGSLIAAGIIGMWIFQVLENIGMDLGLMPITGIPLPFMSYGSSFMLVNFMAVGLLLSIWKERPLQRR